ncbi:hypothetical protein ACIRRH_42595 [Kitasatospora sp. NPDC101235]|uniref:hypothetical protein n=1 Tax=Kitasatospora sp. NPDC101235 TaxID=3364101 RepID=UPI0038162F4E
MGGLPVYVSGHPYAILRPTIASTNWAELTGLVVLTAGDAERRAVVDQAPALTRVVDLLAWLSGRTEQ